MIYIENAKIYGELKEEYTSLLESKQQLIKEKQQAQDEYLNQLFQRLQLYFNHVNFNVKNVADQKFEATYKGISYSVFIADRCLFIKHDGRESYSFRVVPMSRKNISPQYEIHNSYLKSDIEEIYIKIDKLKSDITSLKAETFSYWFNEEEKELMNKEKVVDQIFS